MTFTSFHFVLFLPVTLFVYFSLPARYRLTWLALTGCYFYMAWRPAYIVLLLASVAIAYVGGIALERESDPRRRRAILISSLLPLLGSLFVFKYFDFFLKSADRALDALGVDYVAPHLGLLLPLGISFYTFQKVGYLVDVYRGVVRAERRPGILLLFAVFFPQLVAGPIERAKNLLPQMSTPAEFDYGRVTAGFRLIAWGFFKKVVVADRLAPFVFTVYSNPHDYQGVSFMVATICFAFQVYCDFSGYTDIAIGSARVFGVNLTQNFKQPYFATSIPDFWKRWHISLSTWLTDYVYTPLTRARFIKLRWYPKLLLCLLLTFLVSGLWHGAQWTFVVWGALHGVFLILSVVSQKFRRSAVKWIGLDRAPGLHTALRIALTFTLVCISYVFFRAEQTVDAIYILTHMFSGVPRFLYDAVTGEWSTVQDQLLIRGRVPEFVLGLLGVMVVLAADAMERWNLPSVNLGSWPAAVRWPAYIAVAFVLVVCGAFYDSARTFIYFQF